MFKVFSLNGLSVFFKIIIGFITSKIIAVYVGPSGMALVGNFRNFTNSVESIVTLGFQNGIVKYVSDNNKVGILDLFGGELIEAKYDDIEFINNSFIVFKQGNYYGMYNYINKKEIASPIYDQIINTKKGYIGIKGLEMFNLDLNNNTNHQKIR